MINSNQLDFREPTLQQVADLCSEFGFACAGEADLACLRALLREGSSRWGRPAPAPAEGEVAELVEELRDEGDARSSEPNTAFHRAADLLERQVAPVPVAVSERWPEGRDLGPDGAIWFRHTDKYGETHWLPDVLPLPSGEVE